jgi:EpsI family protein
MSARLLVLTACFLATAAYTERAQRAETAPLRRPLAELPRVFGGWQGGNDSLFPPNIVQVLGVDEYLNRNYAVAGQPAVSLYVGYYRSQRHGDTMHSPMNCLPGSGWQPAERSRLPIDVASRAEPIVINRLLVQKGLEQAVVLYWYQGLGRIVASEYASKFYLVYDAMRLNRSDGAMVRVTTEVLPQEPGTRAADRRAIEFVQAVFPHLDAHLP